MSEPSAWVAAGTRAWVAVPEVGAAAFSPDDAYLAWVDGRDARKVHVTELATARSVLTLRGPHAAALCWGVGHALAVVRVDGAAVGAVVHAIPDGGVLARVPLPGVRSGVRAQPSADHRSALLTWPAALRLRGPTPLGACVLRGDALEGVTTVPLGARDGAEVAVTASLSPDGERVAVARAAADGSGGSSVAVLTCDGDEVSRATVAGARAPASVAWVHPTRLLSVWAAPTLRFARVDEGRATVFATLGADMRLVAPECVVDPSGERALVSVRAPRGDREDTMAMLLDLEGAGALSVAVELSRGRSPGADGGACWSARGDVTALSLTRSGDVKLSRHTPPTYDGRAELYLSPGVYAEAIGLTASPTRRRALARWRTRDENDVTASRAAVLTLDADP